MTQKSTLARVDEVRAAQVWEDADILLEALDIQEGETVLSIASSGDTVLSLLTSPAARVLAIDLSAAQLHCLALRVAAFKVLSHDEVLELIGSRPSSRRPALYRRLRSELSDHARHYWDRHEDELECGLGSARVGTFEAYVERFRTRALPLMLPTRERRALFEPKARMARDAFYLRHVATWRWKGPFRIFFSLSLLEKLRRDAQFFRYAQGDLPGAFESRLRHVLTVLRPWENPYLTWIMTGSHLPPGAKAGQEVLPHYLRPEHFERIRSRLHLLEWKQTSLEEVLEELGEASVDRFNLSVTFESMGTTEAAKLLSRVAMTARPGGRVAYWNILAPRSSELISDIGVRPMRTLRPRGGLAQRLFEQDKSFFYSAFVVEDVVEEQDVVLV